MVDIIVFISLYIKGKGEQPNNIIATSYAWPNVYTGDCSIASNRNS